MLQGHVTAVMGAPGAGKCTLWSALTESTARVATVGPNSWLIDMPGLRELGTLPRRRYEQYLQLLHHMRLA